MLKRTLCSAVLIVSLISMTGCNITSALSNDTLPVSKLKYDYISLPSFISSPTAKSLVDYLDAKRMQIETDKRYSLTIPYLNILMKQTTQGRQSVKLIFGSSGLENISLSYITDKDKYKEIIKDIEETLKLFRVDILAYVEDYKNMLDGIEEINKNKVYIKEHVNDLYSQSIEIKADADYNNKLQVYFHVTFNDSLNKSFNVREDVLPNTTHQDLTVELLTSAEQMANRGYVYSPKNSFRYDMMLEKQTVRMFYNNLYPFSVTNEFWEYENTCIGESVNIESLRFKIPSIHLQNKKYMKMIYDEIHFLNKSEIYSFDKFMDYVTKSKTAKKEIKYDSERGNFLLTHDYIKEDDTYIISYSRSKIMQ